MPGCGREIPAAERLQKRNGGTAGFFSTARDVARRLLTTVHVGQSFDCICRTGLPPCVLGRGSCSRHAPGRPGRRRAAAALHGARHRRARRARRAGSERQWRGAHGRNARSASAPGGLRATRIARATAARHAVPGTRACFMHQWRELVGQRAGGNSPHATRAGGPSRARARRDDRRCRCRSADPRTARTRLSLRNAHRGSRRPPHAAPDSRRHVAERGRDVSGTPYT